MPATPRQRPGQSVRYMRFLIIAAVLLTLGFASPVMQEEEPAEMPAEPDIAATVQVAVEGTVSAWLTALPTPAPTATATPPALEPIILIGKGRLNTTPFRLDGGNYSVEWTATDPPTNFGCFHGGELKAVDGTPVLQPIGGGSVPKGTTRTGASQLYNVKPNTYYLAMGSGCDWVVTIAPQR